LVWMEIKLRGIRVVASISNFPHSFWLVAVIFQDLSTT
jgi:hypothetical protein